jgi:hypothetical protein
VCSGGWWPAAWIARDNWLTTAWAWCVRPQAPGFAKFHPKSLAAWEWPNGAGWCDPTAVLGVTDPTPEVSYWLRSLLLASASAGVVAATLVGHKETRALACTVCTLGGCNDLGTSGQGSGSTGGRKGRGRGGAGQVQRVGGPGQRMHGTFPVCVSPTVCHHRHCVANSSSKCFCPGAGTSPRFVSTMKKPPISCAFLIPDTGGIVCTAREPVDSYRITRQVSPVDPSDMIPRMRVGAGADGRHEIDSDPALG